ncbi:MAG: putative holliday junction resolvase [Parcubacteria group bacterium Gr01-1014_72]|nr:MAG: putative holliday junction resolvase [Parcubacteria group bacterium Gr01-1014_72]
MRYLGIDYGIKRVGIALSDEGGRLAFPKTVLPNDKALVPAITALCVQENVGAIVVGESRDFGGRENTIAPKARAFADALEKATGLPIHFEQEYWSSEEAVRFQPRRPDPGRGSGLRLPRRAGRPMANNDMLDASAAAIILQRYLEKI